MHYWVNGGGNWLGKRGGVARFKVIQFSYGEILNTWNSLRRILVKKSFWNGILSYLSLFWECVTYII